MKSRTAYSRVRIEVAETPFFSRSVSEFVLNKPRTEYTIYPDIIWNYEALKNNAQAEPVSVAVKVEMNGKDLGQRVRTFSVRSVKMPVGLCGERDEVLRYQYLFCRIRQRRESDDRPAAS